MGREEKQGKKQVKTKVKENIQQDLSTLQEESPAEMAAVIGGAGAHSGDPQTWANNARMMDKIAAGQAAEGHFVEAAQIYQGAAADWAHAAEEDPGDKQYMSNSAGDLSHSGEEFMQEAQRLSDSTTWDNFHPVPRAYRLAEQFAEQALESYSQSGTEFSTIGEFSQAGTAFEHGAHAGEFQPHHDPFIPATDLNSALGLYQNAASAFVSAGEHNRAGAAYAGAADLYSRFGDYQQAGENYADAAEQYNLSGHFNEGNNAYNNAADSYHALAKQLNTDGSYLDAAQAFDRAAHYFGDAESTSSQANMYFQAANNYQAANHLSKAVSQYSEAADIYTDLARTENQQTAGTALQEVVNCYTQAFLLAQSSTHPNEHEDLLQDAHANFSDLFKYYQSEGMTSLAAEAKNWLNQFSS